MQFSTMVLFCSILAVGISTGALANNQGLAPICTNLLTADNGCIRYVVGFDVTGVVTEVDLTFPQIKTKCDCIQACLNRPTTCAAWVYKFTSAAAVKSGHRTCTLYSQFNLPADVTIEIDINSRRNRNINAPEINKLGNNPQAGAVVVEAFKDVNLNTIPDNNAFSGAVWQLANGKAIC